MANTKVLYQHGTLALLVPGLLDGTASIKDIMKHGDTGIGTGQGLDGELIFLNGIPYQINSKGKVQIVKDDFSVPFASAHFADFNFLNSPKNIKDQDLYKQVLKQSGLNNTFFAFLLKGTFKKIQTRAVEKSQKPYQTLLQTAKKQSVFSGQDIKGTLLSYYAPDLFNGVAVGGFHSHFLSDNKDFGGHVLNFELAEGELSLQVFDSLDQHLPIDNEDFMKHDFSTDNINSDLARSEQ
ncbi:acetolactate decarboxylase [Oenococcus alcoholitolerans]|uniref:acetolactate decarboxylase n=1 Tax=Oenococcus alcoholitolerans TaxID=931074 RepID=UPI003F71BA11